MSSQKDLHIGTLHAVIANHILEVPQMNIEVQALHGRYTMPETCTPGTTTHSQ
jgi:hypothetical protein